MEPDLNPCNDPGYTKDLNADSPPDYCHELEFDEAGNPIKKSLKEVAGADFSWIEEYTQEKDGIGQSALCDPMQTGHIMNEQGFRASNPNTVYRYSKSIRGTDEAVTDLFRDIVVIDEQGKAHNVPIVWGPQEKAVAMILSENVRNDPSLVVDRIRLPILAIHSTNYEFNQRRYIYHKAIDYLRTLERDWKPGFTTMEAGNHERDTVFGVARGIPLDISYTLYAWAMHHEDINQILTQVITKFSPIAYIRVRGISWEIGVKLTSIANNADVEPGDKKLKIHKFQFGLMAESFVAQPIQKRRAVLKTKVEMIDTTSEDRITEVIARLEEAVKELKE